MEAMFLDQEKVRLDLGLTKVRVVRNKNYKAHGTKSYVYLLNKFGFNTTKPGPYTFVNRLQQRGLANTNVATGGRVHMDRHLVKQSESHNHDHHGASHAISGGGSESGTATSSTPALVGMGGGQTGEVTAEDQQNDSMYLCEVDIGTPPQKLQLDFDTGSSDLWVFSSELTDALQQNHNIYIAKTSSTAKAASDETWKIQYGDGSSASGDVVTDVVSIGGLKIQNQAVELASQLSAQFSQGTGDGLLGLAWPSINTIMSNGRSNPQPTFVANMISSGAVPKESQLFTSCFYSARDQNATSFYTFGYIDQELVKASGQDIVWTDVDNSKGFWMFNSESYSINGKASQQSGNTAIADTGTTLCLVSDEVCDALYKAIPGAKYDDQQQGYLIPTTVSADDLPTVTVAVGNTQFTIQKEDLVFAEAGSGYSYGGVQSRGQNPFDILGDTFLKSIYAIWDQGNSRFGCVPKIQVTQKLNQPSGSNGQ